MKRAFWGLLITLLIIQSPAIGQVCPATPGTELITNGDFSAGNTGFASNLTNDLTPNLDGDHYAITTNPNPWNSGYFATIGDHTTGTGNMIIFDFNNSSANDPIYKVTVNVNTGQTYFFSGWFANIATNNYTACGTCPGGQYITNSPQLQFKIVAGTGGPNLTSPTVYVDSLSNNWNQYFTEYTATSTGTVEIQIVNLRGGNGSNDLALDDISFSNGCDKISNLNTLGLSSDLPDELSNCNVAFPYNLDPGLPGSYGYTWKTNPSTTVGTNTTYDVASAPADGTKYYICYEYIPGCPRIDSVTFRNTPISVEVGTDRVICAPVSYTISSGVSTPPASVQWYKDAVLIPGATGTDYTATEEGVYSVDVSRAGCGSATDQMTITSPVSSFAGSGTYCISENSAEFEVTSGTTQVKWYTVPSGGTPLNPGDSNPSISLPYASTNTTTPGCVSGLYAEDISSYPGALMASAPCALSGNTTDELAIRIEVSQTTTLSSADFYHGAGWGATGTFTFRLYNNNPTGGPWCGSCTPPGNYDGKGGLIYTEDSPSYTVGGSPTLRTLTLTTPQVLSPGVYWMSIQGNGTPINGFQSCAMARNTVDLWSSPIADNTGNNVLVANKALQGGNAGGQGGLFNLGFQVGSNNACSRLFICATESCPAPVEFLSFNAYKKTNGNLLVWKTATEINSAYFLVQRSTDGINFGTIGSVTAAGSSQNILSYTFLDETAESSEVYYRLKEVDIDEAFQYSNIVYLSNEPGASILGIYPVPVKSGNNLNIDYVSNMEEEVILEVIDNLGRTIFSEIHSIGAGKNTLKISTYELASGCYYLQVKGNSLQISKFLVE